MSSFIVEAFNSFPYTKETVFIYFTSGFVNNFQRKNDKIFSVLVPEKIRPYFQIDMLNHEKKPHMIK